MKRCSKCGELKSESEFCKDSRSKDGLSYRCKACTHQYMQHYYEQNKTVLIQRGKDYRKTHPEKQRDRSQRAKYVMNGLKSKCVKCGEDRLYCIDFHHIDPKLKRLNISTLKWFSNIEAIKEEVDKCVCLCKNCHAEFHFLYGLNPRQPVESLYEYLEGGDENDTDVEL